MICSGRQKVIFILFVEKVLEPRVPDDICIIGFDNSDTSRFIRPALSTIAHDQKGIATAALELIEAMITGETPEDRHLITHLVPRETTRLPVLENH